MSQLSDPALAAAADQVLQTGVGLAEPDVLAVLRLPDEELPAALELAHQVRMRWCGPEVEVEGIVSVKTGGCPEDCHFCSQSGLFTSPVRAVWLDIPALVEAARQTAATGATEFCIVAAVRGPDERLMAQMRAGVAAIREAVDIQVAASLGMLTQEQVDELVAMGVHRYNHNLETARSFFPRVVSTHSWEERFDTLRMVRDSGMEVCCGGILGLGESLEQRAEFAVQLASLAPDEVPLNFLNPRPGTPLGDAPVVDDLTGALEPVVAEDVVDVVLGVHHEPDGAVLLGLLPHGDRLRGQLRGVDHHHTGRDHEVDGEHDRGRGERDPGGRVDVASLKKLAVFMFEKLAWFEKPVNVDEMVDQSHLPR